MKQPVAIVATFVGMVLCISACQPKESQTLGYKPIDTVAIQTAIADLGAVVQKAHDTNDERLLASTWAKDGIFSVAGSPPVMGREAIVTAIRNLPPPPSGSKMKMNPIEITVLNEDWAYVFGIDSLTYTPAGSKEPIKETSTFFVLVHKSSEGWQTYREILTPNQPQKN